jgi:hypothetical protein
MENDQIDRLGNDTLRTELRRLKADSRRLREALQSIADEAVNHHEHNPESRKDRLPKGYTRILNIASTALSF